MSSLQAPAGRGWPGGKRLGVQVAEAHREEVRPAVSWGQPFVKS